MARIPPAFIRKFVDSFAALFDFTTCNFVVFFSGPENIIRGHSPGLRRTDVDNEFIQCLFGGENNYNNDGRGGEKEENEKMSRRFKGGSLVYSRRPADPVPISPHPPPKNSFTKITKF